MGPWARCGTPGGSLSQGSGSAADLLAEVAAVLVAPGVDDFDEVCALRAAAKAVKVRNKAICFMSA